MAKLTAADLRQLIRTEVHQAFIEANGTAPKNHHSKPYLSVTEAAETARLAISTIRLYIRKGRLKALKVGRRVVIARTEAVSSGTS